jgi:signal transduction histidine kinase
MNKKLLHKTQRTYLVFSILLFVIVAPLFYVLSNKFYIDEVDETLLLQKSDFINHSISKLKIKDIPNWNRFNNAVEILNPYDIKKDTLFYGDFYNKTEQENDAYRVLKTPITIEGKPYVFSAKVNLIESEDFMLSIVLLFLSLIMLLILGMYIITKKLSLRLWRPFYKTLYQIENFEIDRHTNLHFAHSDTEEFNRLNRSINDLIERNIAIYNNQREFVENAAHELQTPIAIFKAKVDTLIQRSDITSGQSELLSALNNAISRLNRVNKNLLLLSKIDTNHFNETEPFSLQQIIEKQLEFFIEQAEQKNIAIKTSFQKDNMLNANYGLTELLVNNLLLNAIRHNVMNGTINITISDKKLEITNTGNTLGLKEEDLFNRFSKSNASVQGSGLGLAIVKKITNLNNWTISYSFSENKHSFSVQF